MGKKYAFEALSIAQGYHDTVILLDGGGYPDGARQRIINQSGKNRLLEVQDLGEFVHFAKAKL